MLSLPPDTVDLAQRLAVAKRLSLEDAVRVAIEEKARTEGIELGPRGRRDPSAEAIAERRARTDSFVIALASLPVVDDRSPHDIMDDLDAS